MSKKSKNLTALPSSGSTKTGWRTIRVFLASTMVATISLAQGPKDYWKTILAGVVSDAVDGRLIDSVSVSAGRVTTRSNAQGVFTLEIPAKKLAMPNHYVLTFSRKNFGTLKRTVSTGIKSAKNNRKSCG